MSDGLRNKSIKVLRSDDVNNTLITSSKAISKEVRYIPASNQTLAAGDTCVITINNPDRNRHTIFNDFQLKYKINNNAGTNSIYTHLSGIFSLMDYLKIRVDGKLVFNADSGSMKTYHMLGINNYETAFRWLNSIAGSVNKLTVTSLTDTATIATGTDSNYYRSSLREVFWGLFRNRIGASFSKIELEFRLVPHRTAYEDALLIGFGASTDMSVVRVREMQAVVSVVTYPQEVVLSPAACWSIPMPYLQVKKYAVTPNSATQTLTVTLGQNSGDGWSPASLINRIFVYGVSSAVTSTYSLTTLSTTFVSTLITDVVFKVNGHQQYELHGQEVMDHINAYHQKHGLNMSDTLMTNAALQSYAPTQFFWHANDGNMYHDKNHVHPLVGLSHFTDGPQYQIIFTLGGLAAAHADIDTAVVVLETTRMLTLYANGTAPLEEV